MNPADFPIDRYLEKIGLADMPQADEAGLQAIHAAQVFSIPFENLDIHLGRPILLKHEDLTDKIINRKRGGYCFELNEMLRIALKSIGFKVRPILARVLYQRTEPGPLTHEGLIVTISGRDWFCDVGFGRPGLRSPLPLVPNRIFEQYGERFRLQRSPDGGWTLQEETEKGFADLYTFLDLPVLDIDIEMSNHFTSTWPASMFRLHRMCALAKPTGRITLLDMELTHHEDGRVQRKTLQAGPEYMDALLECFGIDLQSKYEDFIL